MNELGIRLWTEGVLALVSGGLLVLTVISRNWVEVAFRIDPDAGSGAAEWIIVGVALTVTVTFVMLAGREWKRRQLLAQTHQGAATREVVVV